MSLSSPALIRLFHPARLWFARHVRNLLPALFVFHAAMPGVASGEYPIPLDELRIRDPFVYAHPSTKTYYLYAQTGNRRVNPEPGLGVEVYRSRDLTNWSLLS